MSGTLATLKIEKKRKIPLLIAFWSFLIAKEVMQWFSSQTVVATNTSDFCTVKGNFSFHVTILSMGWCHLIYTQYLHVPLTYTIFNTTILIDDNWFDKTFNSQKWLTRYTLFSLQYPYINQQTGNENTKTYQLEVVVLIWHQVLLTNLPGNV